MQKLSHMHFCAISLSDLHSAWPAGPRGGSSSAWASLGHSAASARRMHPAPPHQPRPPALSTYQHLATSLSTTRSWLRPAWRTWLR